MFIEFPTSRIVIVGTMTLKIKINSFEMSLQATIFATLVNCDLLLEKNKIYLIMSDFINKMLDTITNRSNHYWCQKL